MIIIDGGSTDGTIDIIKKYKKFISHWVSEKDEGQTHAINKGFVIATGDYICFQNSDDIFLPGAFHAFAKAMINNPNKDIFYGNFKHVDKEDTVLDIQKLMPVNLFLQIYKGPLIHNQACFWKREIFQKIGFLDESYRFDLDYEFFTRILFHGYKPYFINNFLGALRHHEDSKTSNLADVSKAEMSRVKKEYKQKSLLTSLIPLKIGQHFGTAYKISYHLIHGDYTYLRRKPYKFK